MSDGDMKIGRLEQMEREQRIMTGALFAIILAFAVGWWFGQRSVDIPPQQPQSQTGLTVGDMSQVCGVLESYGDGPLPGCETAAQNAITHWAVPGVDTP